MCGIVGIVAKRNIINVLLECLQRLEYRGYDSAGLAVVNKNKQLIRLRRLGKVQELIQEMGKYSLYSSIGIAHTRWATHGAPSEINAHPHISENIVVVHNGIIENYESLRETLQKCGYCFISETDTEIIAHLIHWEQTQGNSLHDAVLRAIVKLRGIYSIIVMDYYNHDALLVVCSGSPVVIGLGIEENFIASDQLALLPITHDFIFLRDGDIAKITYSSVAIFDSLGRQIQRKNVKSNVKYDACNKGVYLHYVQKEIYEQPDAIRNTLIGRISDDQINLSELGSNISKIFTKVEYIKIVACGTSYNSGMISRYWFESLAGIPCDVEIASEFCYRKPSMCPNSLLIVISQSGETADTLAALRLFKNINHLASLAICNMTGSSLVRESDLTLMTRAGIEVGVASTKTFTTQLTVLLILVAKLACLKSKNTVVECEIIRELKILPKKIEQVLLQDKYIEQLAKKFSNKHHVLFLGRGDHFPVALEGALKLKEMSYIHAEAYAAGELKHGPLALIDCNMPVVILAPNNKLLKKLKSNIEEIRIRGGQLYIFTDLDTEFCSIDNINLIKMPHAEKFITPIFYSIPLQLLAYHVGLAKDINVDRPRNLAKSVTVE